MKIAYHKDKQSGKILRHYKLCDKHTAEEIRERVECYNSVEGRADRVYVIEVKEGSFLEYLINRCEEKIKFPSEVIGEAIDCLEDALEAVRSLEVSYE